ncbi:hypothetical protein PSJ60_24115 [Escherichia coli]|nr:hypothetical protein [Escherichia coli]MDC9067868.1 hypothetical protein [Escherichia coli]
MKYGITLLMLCLLQAAHSETPNFRPCRQQRSQSIPRPLFRS